MERPVSLRHIRHHFLRIMLLLIVASGLLAQTRNDGVIPADLKPSLDSRLTRFTQAQADGKWDEVATLLGRYRMGGVGHHPLTGEAKACLINQMKEIPMISFETQSVRASTEILGLPLDKRFWDLIGEAMFKTPATGEHKSQSKVTAYRDKGEWYFSPPNYDSYWLKAHLTEADLAVDRADEIEIEDTASSPIEISDVHAFIDKEYRSLLRVTFKLKNRTSKKVSAFSVLFYDGGGSVEYSAPHAIEPGGATDEKETVSRWVYFCDGVTRNKFVVDSVSFTDGTEWNRPRKR